MILEIYSYMAKMPNSDETKARPVLVIGNDRENGLQIVDIHYCMISSSSSKGTFDVEIDEQTAISIGLKRKSIIKTTKIYTGSARLLGGKISTLPDALREEFRARYKEYQAKVIACLTQNHLNP